jgi:hypothetical protein
VPHGMVLVDDQGIDQLRPGEAREPERAAGGVQFADWLMQAKPQDAAELDFRVAMRIAKEQPVVFSVGSSRADPLLGTGRVPGRWQMAERQFLGLSLSGLSLIVLLFFVFSGSGQTSVGDFFLGTIVLHDPQDVLLN